MPKADCRLLKPRTSNPIPQQNLNTHVTFSSYYSQKLQNQKAMNFEHLHLLALLALFLLLLVFYFSPFELTVNEDEDDEE